MNRAVSKRNHASGGIANSVMGLISSVISGIVNITPVAVLKRENTKNALQNLLYSPVYLSGKSFEQVKNSLYATYQKNPALFRQYYDELWATRQAHLEQGIHPSQGIKTKEIVLIVFVILLVIVMFYVWKK